MYKISQKGQKLFNIYYNENNEFKYEHEYTDSGEVKGNISIVRQYNRELTQTEITQNYNAQKSRFGL